MDIATGTDVGGEREKLLCFCTCSCIVWTDVWLGKVVSGSRKTDKVALLIHLSMLLP